MSELKSNVRNVETMSVIVIRSIVGKGVDNDPVREITEYFSGGGELLVHVDEWKEEHLTKRVTDFACAHAENHDMYFNNGDSFCRHCGQPLTSASRL